LKRETRYLLEKAIDSAVIGVDHYNRLWDRGRTEAVLIFLDRAFELLMKAIIVEQGLRITNKRDPSLTIGSSEALRKCVSHEKLRCISEEQAISIQNLNLLRDAAQHYIVSLSEGQLFVYTQSALSIFLGLLKSRFEITLGEKFPERLSLVTAAIPANFSAMLDLEFATIRSMLGPGSRKKLDAKAKIRAFAVLERSLAGSEIHHSDAELDGFAGKVGAGQDWRKIFPGINTVRIDPNGSEMGLVLKIAKAKAGDEDAVALVPVGTPGAAVVGVKTVNDLSYYSLYLKDIAAKVRTKYPPINRTDVQNMIRDLNLKADPEMYKEYKMGAQEHKRYSPKALDAIIKLSATHAKLVDQIQADPIHAA
jgi:hypothetical protein